MKKIKEDVFADFKRRKYFTESKKIYPRFPMSFLRHEKKYNDFILSTEELATIFHLPSTVIGTPTFERAESKRGEAPLNLPF
jgi:hypothetical protein